MEVCSLPLLQQLSLKNTRELEPACSDLSDGEEQQVLKARRYSGIYSPGKTATEPEAAAPLPRWSPADSSTLYNVPGWGDKFFKASDDGHILVAPQGEGGPTLDLYALTEQLTVAGLRAPLLFRFLPIVGHRIAKLNAAFSAAIERFEYQGTYNGVFPVKANHDKSLIDAVLEYGTPHQFGLEVGSKAELVMVMARLAGTGRRGVNLVCNGFKDAEYMELVLHCRELGMNAMVVMEQYSELDLLLSAARRLGVRPSIGIRAKLTTRHAGHWGSTSGDKAKFGLRAREIVGAVNTLAEEGMLDCLNLLHFHVGSQITNIRMVKEVMREASFLYAELVQMGATMRFIDCGGGLAVDYDGSFTDSHASMSYTLQHYANDVVSAVQEVCIQRSIPPPTIITESGRALASHASVLVFDVLNTPECLHEKRVEQEEVVESIEIRDDKPLTKQLRAAARSGKGKFLLMTFKEVYDNITADAFALREAYNDASYFKDEGVRAFKLGVLSLEERAQVDMMFDAACERIREVAREADLPLPDALRPDAVPHTKMYHVNLSVFRSAVDSWAIQQLFPIVPIHRLEEEPTVAATLADLTCDSDGKVDRFINPRGGDPLPALPLHPLRNGEKYYLALFLTGVYQEVMGSIHNMFGSLNTVVVREARGQAGDAALVVEPAAVQGCEPAPCADAPAHPMADDASSASSASLAALEGGMEADSAFTATHAPADGAAAAAATAAVHDGAPGVPDGAETPAFMQDSGHESFASGSGSGFAAFGASGGGCAAGLVLPSLQLSGYELQEVVPGETVGQVLSRANHDVGEMLRTVGAATAAAVASGEMPPELGQRLLSAYTARMRGYTYML
ncbi:arginine decarboxylase [Chlorella sorokiniana]|uniref:Arginine decarboxylase n=1 Tax=Chlorella sorokiniana TaxID=3076 RepID=A0A2P6THG5_CHLSO|nr:arginine decarboxylase [Chlorella sorokiniana]|eukprot:PRW33729.1 arginine decarboxylase [Chlorella sorokiniana]